MSPISQRYMISSRDIYKLSTDGLANLWTHRLVGYQIDGPT